MILKRILNFPSESPLFIIQFSFRAGYYPISKLISLQLVCSLFPAPFSSNKWRKISSSISNLSPPIFKNHNSHVDHQYFQPSPLINISNFFSSLIHPSSPPQVTVFGYLFFFMFLNTEIFSHLSFHCHYVYSPVLNPGPQL